MSLPSAFKTTLCQAFTNGVNKLSLHTADPGTTGANDSAVQHATVTWTGPTDGVATALVQISSLTGDFTHIGLWSDSTFKQGIPCVINYGAATNVAILVTHEVDDDQPA